MPPLFTSFSASRTLLCLALLVFSLFTPSVMAVVSQLQQHDVTAQSVDPDKEMSELNHRVAGMFLLAIGSCIIVSKRYESFAWLRWLAPLLFIAAGLFLAAWSDDEIWPRGDLSWSWLIYHDPEARQHKLYALLLIILGLVEGIQGSRKYRRPWLSIMFPVLGIIGGVSLLFHHHNGEDPSNTAGRAVHPSVDIQNVRSNTASQAAHPPGHDHAGLSHSLSSSTQAATSARQEVPLHQHHLNGSEAKIQREHAWFAVVGFGIAILKLLSDSGKSLVRVPKHLWAYSILLLGLSLLFYTE